MVQEASSDKSRFKRRVLALEALGHRGSATENEDQAADYLSDELSSMGIDPHKAYFQGSDSLGARVLVHVVVAAAGLALVRVAPLATIALAAFALISFIGESNTQWMILSRLLGRKPSCNVIGRLPTATNIEHEKPGQTIVLCAHIDTQRTGMMWSGPLVQPLARLYQRAPGPMKSPMFPVMAAFVAQLFIGLAELLWPQTAVIIGVSVAFGVIYLIAGIILFDWSRGPFVPGACDNATGAAAALELAERWHENPQKDVELVVLLCGCEESGMLGARAWLDSHADELSQRPHTFLILDTLGYGAPRYLDAEHSLAAHKFRYPKQMLELCEKAAQRTGLTKAGPFTIPTFTDGLAFLARGLPGAAVLTFTDDVHMPNYHQLTDTSDRMDFEVGWQAVNFGWHILQAMAQSAPGGPKEQPKG